ncbi:hypothetical protein BJM27_04030 [Listeria monocytogenes]|nr:hypothetical protein BJM27_04030 [Listeria monocytogenes]
MHTRISNMIEAIDRESKKKEAKGLYLIKRYFIYIRLLHMISDFLQKMIQIKLQMSNYLINYLMMVFH